MKDYHINIFYRLEDKGYIEDIPDLKHCSAFGKSQEGALHEVLIAKDLWIESAILNNMPAPKPRYFPAPYKVAML